MKPCEEILMEFYLTIQRMRWYVRNVEFGVK